MSTKIKSMSKKVMKQKGVPPEEIAIIHQNARKAAEEMKKQLLREELAVLFAIPLNVLFNDYWQKSASKRAPKFIDECLKLLNAVESGHVSVDDLEEVVFKLSGLEIKKIIEGECPICKKARR